MLFVLVLLVPLVLLLVKMHMHRHLPPGPNAWQILCNISELKKRPHVAFTHLAKTYGPLMSLCLGSRVVIVASSSAAAKEILRTQDRDFSGRYLPCIYYKIPNGQHASISTEKECTPVWKFLRGIGQNFIFSANSIEDKAEMRKARVSEVVECLQSKVGQVVKLDDIINATLINIISHVLVSKNLLDTLGEDENSCKVRRVGREIVETVSLPSLSDLFPSLETVDFITSIRAVKLRDRIVSVWGDIVRERRAKCIDNSVVSRDFLDGIFAEASFSDDQICVLLMELILAGTDSSTGTAVWLMAELLRHPQILQRVRDEIAYAFDVADTRIINESILTECRYLHACIKETLRLHISGPFLLPHRAVETCKIDNYVIPKDSTVLVNAWAIHLEPTTWKDATVFDPDRFIDSKIDFRSTDDFKFMPFSAGRRTCPGLNLAIKNTQMLVASLVHHFDWTLSDGSDPINIDINEKFGTVIMKEKPLLLIPRMRDQVMDH